MNIKKLVLTILFILSTAQYSQARDGFGAGIATGAAVGLLASGIADRPYYDNYYYYPSSYGYYYPSRYGRYYRRHYRHRPYRRSYRRSYWR